MDKRILIAMILVLSLVGTASATTWSVDDSGGADFTGIQDAINNASAGDTIIVYSGVYNENVVVDKSVTLKGNDQPVVDAGGEGDAIRLTVDGITLVGFTATNAGSSLRDAGIVVASNDNIIAGNIANNNSFGIYLGSYRNNIITGNNANNNYCGIRLYSSSNNNTITGNNVSSNEKGISLSYSRNNTITGNNVCNNEKGINLYSSSNNFITGNNVRNNGNGIDLYSSSNNSITSNTHVNDGISVYSSYQNTVEDNTVNGKPLVYLEDVSDYKVEDAGQVIIVNSNNITIENLDLSNTSGGIALWKTENSKISNNTVCNNNRGGIRIYYSRNNTITGNNVRNNEEGIGLYYSRNNFITSNNVGNNNGVGIYLSSSSNNNTITGNNVSNNNRGGICLDDSSNNSITGNTHVNDGLSVYSSYQNTVENNTVNGKPLVYLKDVSNYKVEDAGQVILVNCTNITIENQNLSNMMTTGIELWETEDCTISNNKICNNSGDGICLFSSCNNSITGNNVCNNSGYGIPLKSSCSNTLTDNNVCNNSGYGILIHESSNNSLTGNNVSYNNDDGICLEGSDNNTITGNNVCNNNKNGIVIYSSCNNSITGNTINSNKQSGITPWDSDNNSITGNTINSNKQSGITPWDSGNNFITGNDVSSNKYYGIYLSYSVNNIIRGNNFSSNNEGTDLSFSSDNNTIIGNNFVNDGLFVSSSHQNTVEDNTVNDKPLVYLENASDYKVEDAGQVILVNCTNITVENLDLSNTSIGVALLNTGNSIISNNTVRNNSRKGIYLLDSSSNTITCNNVYNNKVGISISADDNLIYLNNFIDNTINDFGPGNIWNSPWEITYLYNGTTYTSNLGNYWDDYEEKYPDSEEIDTTGILDTPYSINSDKDTYPLTMRSENYIILTQKECEVDVNNIRYDWYESLSWIKKNTPDQCVDYYVSFPGDKTYHDSAYSVMSWCDYNNWITCIAHRIPVANSQVAATFFITSNESEANEIADVFDVRYVVSDFPMADVFNAFYNKFSVMTVWFGDTEGYYTQVDTYEGPQIAPSTKYFSTMVARLHIFDGRGVALSEDFCLEPLRHYRLIHESPITILNMGGQAIKHVKVFEYVKGAKIKGCAPNGSTVMIATNITTNQGREFMYPQMAISNGTYEFTVPYSTDGPIEGGTNFDVLAAPYVLREGHIENETMVFDTRKEVGIAEEEVMEGKTVRVDLV